MTAKRKLRLFDIVSLSFASFVSVELMASQASLGPSMIFTMIVFGGLYLICHGLIAAELGSTYPDQGGIYVWILNAFGNRWAARSTWWYWLNMVAFVPSTLVILIIVIQQIFGLSFNPLTISLIAVAGIWLIVGLTCMSLRDSKIVTNTGAVLKLVVCAALIVGGGYYALKHGSATEFSFQTVMPSFDMTLLALIPTYIYGLTGMDLISCNAGEMENPRRDVPRALLISGILTIFVYILSGMAILWILPQASIDPSSGMIDAIIAVYGASKLIVVLLGIALILVYVSYIFGWAIGGNAVALEAGEAGELPAIFAKSTRAHAPSGPAILMGIAATVLILVYGMSASSGGELFWMLLAFTSIVFFMPYIVLAFALIRLRKIDPDAERPFKIPGRILPYVVAAANVIFLVIGVAGFMVPPEGDNVVTYLVSVILGLVISQIIGEVLIARAAKKKDREGVAA